VQQGYLLTITVRRKVGAFDPESEAILKNMVSRRNDIGAFAIARLFTILIDGESEDIARSKCVILAAEFLTNPQIETFEVRLAR